MGLRITLHVRKPEQSSEREEFETNESSDVSGGEENSSPESEQSKSSASLPSRLTKRQRSRYFETEEELLSLPTERIPKKHVTAEEHALKRAEMARRRKHLSDKRTEEVKMDTINRLLRKQAGRTRKTHSTGDSTPVGTELDGNLVKPIVRDKMSRWVSNSQGQLYSYPESWFNNHLKT